MKTRKKLPPGVILGILGGALLLVILFSFPLGRYPVSVPQLMQQLMSDLFGTPAPADENLARVIYRIRLPRILLAVLAGGSLSAAGAAYQGVFQNPMASPDLLGASSGASFGAALGIILELPSGGVTGLAFFMSLLTVLAAWLVSSGTSPLVIIRRPPAAEEQAKYRAKSRWPVSPSSRARPSARPSLMSVWTVV